MKIAIVTDAWHPQVNGVVTTLTATINTLRKAGHTVLPITPAYFKTLPCPTYPEIRLSRFPGRKITALLDAFAPDAVHIATEAPLGWAARAYCRRNAIKDLAENNGYEIAGPGMEEVGWAVARGMIEHKIDKLEQIDSKIRSIEDALKTIVYGRFGVCQNCEAQIGINRLLAIPEARFCIDCQSEREQQTHPQAMVA